MNTAGPVVIIGCGALKRPTAAPAADLYRGQLFTSALAAALALAPRDRILILSARYRLLGLDDVIAPYDLTLGQPGAITAPMVTEQARTRGILDQPVTVLASARYADLCREVWPAVTAPLAHQGIGHQRHTLAVIRQEGTARPCLTTS